MSAWFGNDKKNLDEEARKAAAKEAQELAHDYSKRGLWREAIAQYNLALEFDSSNGYLYNDRGWEYLKIKDYINALKDFNKAIAINTDDYLAYTNRGLLCYRLKEYNKALSDFNKAIEIKPDYSGSYHNRALVHHAMGMHKNAMNDYTKAIELNHQDFEAYNNRGILWVETFNDSEEAEKDFKKALNIFPGFSQAQKNLEKLAEKREEYEERSNLTEDNQYDSVIKEGVNLRLAGDFNNALQKYNLAIKLEPERFEAYYNRGYLNMLLMNLDQSIEDYTFALKFAPSNAIILKNRAIVYSMKGMRKEAMADIERAQELNLYIEEDIIDNIKKLNDTPN